MTCMINSPPYSASHFLHILLVNLCLSESSEFLSFPRSPNYSLQISYWSFGSLLNKSERFLGRWRRTDTSSHILIKYHSTTESICNPMIFIGNSIFLATNILAWILKEDIKIVDLIIIYKALTSYSGDWNWISKGGREGEWSLHHYNISNNTWNSRKR